MREILFRGKRLDNGEWLEGSLWNYLGVPKILPPANIVGYDISPDTVGQYTGLTDKNGVKIFEDDCIRVLGEDTIGVIRYGKYRNPFDGGNPSETNIGFYVDWVSRRYKDILRKDLGYWNDKVEIIGNIHDNPELLEEHK